MHFSASRSSVWVWAWHLIALLFMFPVAVYPLHLSYHQYSFCLHSCSCALMLQMSSQCLSDCRSVQATSRNKEAEKHNIALRNQVLIFRILVSFTAMLLFAWFTIFEIFDFLFPFSVCLHSLSLVLNWLQRRKIFFCNTRQRFQNDVSWTKNTYLQLRNSIFSRIYVFRASIRFLKSINWTLNMLRTSCVLMRFLKFLYIQAWRRHDFEIDLHFHATLRTYNGFDCSWFQLSYLLQYICPGLVF